MPGQSMQLRRRRWRVASDCFICVCDRANDEMWTESREARDDAISETPIQANERNKTSERHTRRQEIPGRPIVQRYGTKIGWLAT